MGDWRKQLLQQSSKYQDLKGTWPNLKYSDGTKLNVDEQGIVRQFVPSDLGVEFHEKMEAGTTLRSLQYQHLHLSYWETPYYLSAIELALSGINIPESVILDLGCGDGRFTELLIEQGAQRIVATDCNLSSLASLATLSEEKGFADRLLLIHSGADTLSLSPEVFDVVVAIGVLYYLNEKFEKGLAHALSLLKKGGLFLSSEPDLEGAAVKALVYEGIKDYLEVWEQGYFIETHAGQKYKFRAFSRDAIQKKYRENGLEIVDGYGLSLLPSLLRIGMVRGHYTKDDITMFESEIRHSFNYFSNFGRLFKHIIWHCRKIN